MAEQEDRFMPQDSFNGTSRPQKRQLGAQTQQRAQAAQGSQGTTLGDNSGTGVNTNTEKLRQQVFSSNNIENRPAPAARERAQMPTRLSEGVDDGRRELRDTISDTQTAMRRGAISKRSGLGIIGRAAGDLSQSGNQAFNTATQSFTQDKDRDELQNQGREGRLQQLRELFLNRDAQQSEAREGREFTGSENRMDRDARSDIVDRELGQSQKQFEVTTEQRGLDREQSQQQFIRSADQMDSRLSMEGERIDQGFMDSVDARGFRDKEFGRLTERDKVADAQSDRQFQQDLRKEDVETLMNVFKGKGDRTTMEDFSPEQYKMLIDVMMNNKEKLGQ